MPSAPPIPVIADAPVADAREVAEVAGVLARAFADNPGFRALLRDSDGPRRLQQTARGMRWAVLAARRCGAVDLIRQDGRVVAVSLRYPPGCYPMTLAGQALMVGMGLCGGPRAIPRFIRLDQFMLRHHPHTRHHYLYFIAVDPAHQGRGLGSALLRHLCARADGDRLPCYLETDTPDNVRLYARHGFGVDSEHEVPGLPGLRMWLMTRPPAA